MKFNFVYDLNNINTCNKLHVILNNILYLDRRVNIIFKMLQNNQCHTTLVYGDKYICNPSGEDSIVVDALRAYRMLLAEGNTRRYYKVSAYSNNIDSYTQNIAVNTNFREAYNMKRSIIYRILRRFRLIPEVYDMDSYVHPYTGMELNMPVEFIREVEHSINGHIIFDTKCNKSNCWIRLCHLNRYSRTLCPAEITIDDLCKYIKDDGTISLGVNIAISRIGNTNSYRMIAIKL